MTGLLKPTLPVIDTRKSITSGLVFDSGFYEGSGTTATDLAGGSVGALTGATWETGQYGTDLDYSAASSVVTHTVASGVQSLETVSIECLINYRANGGGGLGRVVHKGNGTNGYFQLNTGHSASNQISFQTTRATTSGIWDYNNVLTVSAWIHCIFTYDGLASNTTNIPSAYFNGVFTAISATVSPVGALIADDSGLYVGNRLDGVRNWDGKISYVRLWNRILTATDVADLYRDSWAIYYKRSLPTNIMRPRLFAPGLAR